MAQTETTEYGNKNRGGTSVLTVVANGGSVSVQVEHSPGVWVTSDEVSADGVFTIFFGYANVRIVPSGGAEFEVH